MTIGPVTIKDHANLSVDIGNIRLSACDVDANGNVENVDLIVDDKLIICENIQTNEAYGQLVYEIFRHFGVLRRDS